MDIRTETTYPSSELSNFTPYTFNIDGVKCNSMEGFLQSLKFNDSKMQEHVCALVGKEAKFKGKKKKWYRLQELYWRGEVYKRDSREYQILLTRAFDALAENTKFQKAILATKDKVLTHSMGKDKINYTVLTEEEFCSQLTRVRENLKNI